MIESTATKIPAAPRPAKALPKISTFTSLATAQIRDPISNRMIAER